MLFPEIVLLLLPAPVVVLKRTLPPAVPTATVADPEIVEFLTVLFEAPLMKRIVLVPAIAPVLILEMTRELPPVLVPSIVRLLAPFKSIKGVARSPDTVLAPEGCKRMDV